jgi:hypothetical protein
MEGTLGEVQPLLRGDQLPLRHLYLLLWVQDQLLLRLDQLAPVPLLSMVMKLLGKIQGVVRLASLCHMACGLLLLPPVRSGDLLPYTAILGSPGFPTTGDSATRFARTSGSIGGFRTIS